MDAFIFGTPARMTPQKPTLCIFGGLYQFIVEGVNITGAGGFATATIRPNSHVKVMPEKLDDIPSILDVFEFCEKTTFIEFLLSIVVNGTVDPDYIVKQVHIRGDKGLILIQARLIPGPMVQAPIEPAGSYSQQSFIHRLGKTEFFVTGQEFDVPSQPISMGIIDVLHNELLPNDRWQGFNSPSIDWSVIYRELIRPLENSIISGYLGGMVNADIGKKYMEFNTIFTTEMGYNQLDATILVYPKTAYGHKIRFIPDDPNALLFEVPDDGTDPFEAWRQTFTSVYPGFLPIILKAGGKTIINGDTYLHTSLAVDGEIQNGWANHFIQTNRPNVMNLYPEAGETNVVDMTVHLKNQQTYHFEAAFFPFMENSKNLAIPYSGDENYPYIIGILECTFKEVLDDPWLFSHFIPNPSGSFLAEQFCMELNTWFGLVDTEPWMLVNISALPNSRKYFVLTQNHPKGAYFKGPSSSAASEPVSNSDSAMKPKRRWGIFGKV